MREFLRQAGELSSPQPARRWPESCPGRARLPECSDAAASKAGRCAAIWHAGDPPGLDSHRHNQLHTGHVTAAMYTGLTDIDDKGNIVPGIAESWEPNKELTSWVPAAQRRPVSQRPGGRRRGREAQYPRIKDPAIGSKTRCSTARVTCSTSTIHAATSDTWRAVAAWSTTLRRPKRCSGRRALWVLRSSSSATLTSHLIARLDRWSKRCGTASVSR